MAAFSGKTAVVTGASSGIGRAVALRLGEAGAHVFAAGRRKEALAGTVEAVVQAGGVATGVAAEAVGSRAAVRAMRACGAQGHIVNVSSSASRLEAPGFYGATKTAVNAITSSLRQELENDTIRVVNVIPGPTATNLARYRPELLRGLVASVGEDIGPPSGGLFSQEALDRAAVAAGQVLARRLAVPA